MLSFYNCFGEENGFDRAVRVDDVVDVRLFNDFWFREAEVFTIDDLVIAGAHRVELITIGGQELAKMEATFKNGNNRDLARMGKEGLEFASHDLKGMLTERLRDDNKGGLVGFGKLDGIRGNGGC